MLCGILIVTLIIVSGCLLVSAVYNVIISDCIIRCRSDFHKEQQKVSALSKIINVIVKTLPNDSI
jgi:hypothetical protein